jgi:hypothetical protein
LRTRHSDADLLGLAREGSAPAFASLLHRHRDVLHRAALRSADPERAAERAIVAAVRQLRDDGVHAGEVRDWLTSLIEDQVRVDPGSPGVERILPADWFDRVWVTVHERWPSGRRRFRIPRWVGVTAGAVALAAFGSTTAYLVVTADASTEVIAELIAEPVTSAEVDTLGVPGPVVEAEPEEAPELFGDVELGELPAYDLSGDETPAPRDPTIGPPAAPGTEDRETDAADAETDAADPTDG